MTRRSNQRGTEKRSAADDPEPAAPADSSDYERSRDELARVVSTLETGGLTLEQSLELWERGEQLARQCEAFLDGASARVEAVLAGSGGDTGPGDDPDDDSEDEPENDPDDDPASENSR